MRWHLQFPAGFLLHDSPNKAAGQDAAIAVNYIIFYYFTIQNGLCLYFALQRKVFSLYFNKYLYRSVKNGYQRNTDRKEPADSFCR